MKRPVSKSTIGSRLLGVAIAFTLSLAIAPDADAGKKRFPNPFKKASESKTGEAASSRRPGIRRSAGTSSLDRARPGTPPDFAKALGITPIGDEEKAALDAQIVAIDRALNTMSEQHGRSLVFENARNQAIAAGVTLFSQRDPDGGNRVPDNVASFFRALATSVTDGESEAGRLEEGGTAEANGVEDWFVRNVVATERRREEFDRTRDRLRATAESREQHARRESMQHPELKKSKGRKK